LAVSISSCGKSSKGKMANEWKVTEMNSTSTDTQSNGDKTVTTTSATETSATTTTVQTSGSSSQTTTQTATIAVNDMKIDKDGTWTWNQDFTIVNGAVTQNTKGAKTGTWSFVSKTKGDEFKKNERVVFNVLTDNSTVVNSVGSSSITSTSADTYLTGENVMIYTIKDSKKDELKLERDGSNTSSAGSSTSSYVSNETITLSAK
jgi:hypothetical protein